MAQSKEEYAKAVCYFLAELLRTHRVSLNRASEIAQKVLANINLIDTEEHFLKLVKELSADFQELIHLGERVNMHIQVTEREQFESHVREFVIIHLPTDPPTAMMVLREAVTEGIKPDVLKDKYPAFRQFIDSKSKSV
jgi:hypothetical protein